MECGELRLEDIPRCPHCGGVLTLFAAPVDMLHAPALNYDGPIAVCRNNECPKYRKSFEWTLKQMGWHIGFRHAYICSSGTEEPISTRVADNEALFVNMAGQPWIDRRAEEVGMEQALLDALKVSIKQWNYALKVHSERVDEIESTPSALWRGREIKVD